MNKNFFKGKKVLVTGGSGSIGSGIIKILIKKKCNVIRILSNDENGIYNLSEELNSMNQKLKLKMENQHIRFLLGDIRDYKRCLLASKNIDIVIHAAALKHVPICEYNKGEAYKTNVAGTKNLVKASIKNKIKLFLFISTDKAAEPTSIMGKSKLSAEKIVIKANTKKNKTKFSVIRFGNILFSRGSVIFKFLSQIDAKEKITVTGLNVSRFFISIRNAVENIFESLSLMKGGEIFIIVNMCSFKIIDLAKSILSIKNKRNLIRISGLREGEKSYEKLLSDNEVAILHPKNKNLALIKHKKQIYEKQKISKNFTDSRFAFHLDIKKIKKLILKEKLL